ncbi:hypothetical protein [Bacillus marinisedimentorum]|uniref:YqgU-like beta propeller domain-containing protein n=1 Tax=Bacillus marinisedimentorum TaxID=1821260 RepID=UPI00316AEB18
MIWLSAAGLLVLSLMTGCTDVWNGNTARDLSERQQPVLRQKEISPSFLAKETIMPLKISREEFNTVSGWYDVETILYYTASNEVYTYNIYTGENEIFHKSDQPVVAIQPNPDRSLFYIHKAVSVTESAVEVLDAKGKSIYRWEGKASELDIVWNPYAPYTLMLTAFHQDWSYTMEYINVDTGKSKPVEIEVPFIRWLDEKRAAYLQWDQETDSFEAPLYAFDVDTATSTNLQNQAVGFFTFENRLVMIDIQGDGVSTYRFYDNRGTELLHSEIVPVLETYSEHFWVPEFSYYREHDTFVYFRPARSGDLFQYHDGFILTSLSLKTGESEELVKLEDNFPLRHSPDGKHILFGYQLENIIQLDSMNILSIVREP